jgi:uncharacterized membrane protein YeaQ/YmgE (transglycosylase-associated protein family)
MGLIVAPIVGAVIGALASLLMPRKARMSLVANVFLGALSSGFGAWLAAARDLAPAGSVLQLAVGGVTAGLLIYLLGTLGLFRN